MLQRPGLLSGGRRAELLNEQVAKNVLFPGEGRSIAPVTASAHVSTSPIDMIRLSNNGHLCTYYTTDLRCHTRHEPEETS